MHLIHLRLSLSCRFVEFANIAYKIRFSYSLLIISLHQGAPIGICNNITTLPLLVRQLFEYQKWNNSIMSLCILLKLSEKTIMRLSVVRCHNVHVRTSQDIYVARV